jgi:hypothetical protein
MLCSIESLNFQIHQKFKFQISSRLPSSVTNLFQNYFPELQTINKNILFGFAVFSVFYFVLYLFTLFSLYLYVHKLFIIWSIYSSSSKTGSGAEVSSLLVAAS